jgi:hypothetical protein
VVWGSSLVGASGADGVVWGSADESSTVWRDLGGSETSATSASSVLVN